MTRKKTKRIVWAAVVIFLMTATFGTVQKDVFAEEGKSTEEKIKDANAVLDQLESSKKEADSKVDSLNQKKAELTGKLADLNQRLQDTSNSLEETQTQLTQKQGQIKKTKKKLKRTQKKADRQYRDMKKRICYIYQNGNESYLEAMIDAESFHDMLNRVDYVNEINDYDTRMLKDYNKTIRQVKKQKQKLDEQKKELLSLRNQKKRQKAEIERLVSDTQQTQNENNAKLEQAEGEAAQAAAQLKKQKEYEAELEAQKAKEDAARLAEIKRLEEEAARQKQAEEDAAKRQQSTSAVLPATPASGSDVEMLAALLQCEAGGTGYDGLLAVGSVVMNRVASPSFPNSVAGVIYQPGQFSPVSSGRFAAVLAGGAPADCRQAAQEVLGGHITNGFLYFRAASSGMPGTVIGANVFY